MAAKIKPPAADPTEPIQARIPGSLRAKLIAYAIAHNITLTQAVTEAVERLVREDEGK